MQNPWRLAFAFAFPVWSAGCFRDMNNNVQYQNGSATQNNRTGQGDGAKPAVTVQPPREPTEMKHQGNPQTSGCVRTFSDLPGGALQAMSDGDDHADNSIYRLVCPDLAGKRVTVEAGGTVEIQPQYQEQAKGWPAWLTVELKTAAPAECSSGIPPVYSVEDDRAKKVSLCREGVVAKNGVVATLDLRRCKRGLHAATCTFQGDFRLMAAPAR